MFHAILESRSYPQECIFNSFNGKQKKGKKKNRKKGRNAYILCKTSYADLKITISSRKP